MLNKEASSTIFKVFGMTRPGIEPRSPGPLENTLTITPMSGFPSWRMSTHTERYDTLSNVRGTFNKFQEFFFFVPAFKIFVDSWKFIIIVMHLIRWLTNFYDFWFKWTATAAIGIHHTKAWLSQLVNFKNAI